MSKNGANGAQNNMKSFVFGSRFSWRIFSGKFGIIRAKIFLIPKKLPAFTAICCTTTSARLTIVGNVAIATGPALLEASRSFVINLIYHIIYKNLFSLRSQYFAKFAITSKVSN